MTVNVRRPKDDVRHDHVFAGGEAGERRHNDFEIFDVKCYKYMLLFFFILTGAEMRDQNPGSEPLKAAGRSADLQ